MRAVLGRLLRRAHRPVLPDHFASALAEANGWASPEFDWDKSTAANCRQDDCDNVGVFAHVRASLDEAFHGHYTPARQRVQDSMIMGALGNGEPAANPWIVFTCGAMGAGKSHVMNWLARQGHFPLHAFVQLDADQFRAGLPEWTSYVRRNPDTAGRLTHKECGYLLEIAQEAALAAGLNVWVDGSMRDHAWYASVLDRIRAERPHYRIAIISVIASHEAILSRTESRAQETGRRVPHKDIMDSLRRTPETIATLGPKTDMLAIIRNEPGSLPKLTSISFPICTLKPQKDPVINEESENVSEEVSKMIKSDSEPAAPWCLLSNTFVDMVGELPIYGFSPCSSTESSRNNSPMHMRSDSPAFSPASSSASWASKQQTTTAASFEEGVYNRLGASVSSPSRSQEGIFARIGAGAMPLSPALTPRALRKTPTVDRDTVPASVAQLTLYLEEQARLAQPEHRATVVSA